MFRKQLAILTCFVALVPPQATAGRKASKNKIAVTVDEPNVYSLEQAHYLLQRVKEGNSTLQSTTPSKLDANEINVNRLNLLRTILSVSAEYNQAAGLNQRAALRQYEEENLPRRKALADRQDAARAELTDVSKQLEEAQGRLATLTAQKRPDTDPELVEVKALIASLTPKQQRLNAEIASLETSLKELRAALNVSSVSPEPVTKDITITCLPRHSRR